ncbi:MAG: RrF2 family transcriptional regulator [Limnochordia bacterium]|nr:Rrf2 family transcriptional regulator [Bacillota bacterium]
MELTRKAEYAIAALADLASQEKGAFILSRDIAKRQRIPPNFIPQIIATLSRKGWVEGVRGSRGGVRLRVPPEEINITQVIELMEGPIALNKCLVSEGICSNESNCVLRGLWAKAQARMLEVLDGTTIADLVEAKRSLEQQED